VLYFYHDTPVAGHPGISNTFSLLKCNYWWSNMKQFVTNYVKGCTQCQANKANTHKTRPPLYPIKPQNTLSFKTIALNFITKLPKSRGFDTILTITNHDCSKAALFIPCRKEIDGPEVAQLYLRHIFPHYGLPRKIISN
jgi:Integrase zinc binding domain